MRSRVLAALLLAAPAAAAELEFRFIGNMAFWISDGDTTLLTDFPYQSGYSGYMSYAMSGVPPIRNGLCLITHGHLDHFDPSRFEELGELAILGPPGLLQRLEAARELEIAPEVSFGPIRIWPLKTPHGTIEHYSYRVAWHGLRLYFTGDTERTEQLLAQTDLEVAFVSPWLLEAVRQQGRRIDADRVVVYHQAPGEQVPLFQGRIVLEQGASFTLQGRD